MKNFEERKAEVFRRSDKRIKERRQRRNHILMACIPVALCIAIPAAFLRPNTSPDGAAGPVSTQAAADGLQDQSFVSLVCSIASITVSGDDFSAVYTEVEKLLLISDRLYAYGTRSQPANGTADSEADEVPKDNAEDASAIIMESANTAYTITIVTHEGIQTEYRLEGNTLRNLTTHQIFTLSRTQADELHKLLGTPDR